MTKTILAVDDSRTIRTAVCHTFATTDFEVLAVDSGPDAMAQIGRGGVSVVLLDVGLPEQDGYEVAKSIKAQAPAVPVLLLTSSFHPWDEARGDAAAVDGHIAKPFDTQSLIDLVERTVAAGPTAAPQLAAVPEIPEDAEVWSFSDDVEEIEEIDIEDVPDLDPAASATDGLPSIDFDAPPSKPAEVSLDLSSFDDPDPAPIRPPSTPPAEPPPSSPSFELPSPSPSPPPPPARPPSLEPVPPRASSRPESGPSSLASAADQVARRAASTPGMESVDEEAVRAMAREVVERIAWEVVPELAETIIREELARLTRD